MNSSGASWASSGATTCNERDCAGSSGASPGSRGAGTGSSGVVLAWKWVIASARQRTVRPRA